MQQILDGLFRHDAVRTDGKGDDDIVIQHKEDAVFVGDIKVEDRVTVPESALQLVNVQRGVSPVRSEQEKLCAGDTLNFMREGTKFALEADRATIGHRSSSISSIPWYSFGSMRSFACFLISSRSFGVGLRDGTVAANRTGSKGISDLVFFPLAFIAKQSTRFRKGSQPRNCHAPKSSGRLSLVGELPGPGGISGVKSSVKSHLQFDV